MEYSYYYIRLERTVSVGSSPPDSSPDELVGLACWTPPWQTCRQWLYTEIKTVGSYNMGDLGGSEIAKEYKTGGIQAYTPSIGSYYN